MLCMYTKFFLKDGWTWNNIFFNSAKKIIYNL